MSHIFRFQSGELPLLISVPHDGRDLPDELQSRMTDAGRSIPDTDWHVAELYEFAAGMGANILVANYSRYVIDLNRAADDAELYPGQVATGLCPLQTFSGESIYRSGGVDDSEKAHKHGFALLWDAHSIAGVVPRLFDGELPDLNLGSNSGTSCEQSIEDAVASIAIGSSYSTAINGRFKGGYITRHYGDPDNSVQALQLEIAQRAYMNEHTIALDSEKADDLRETLRKMLGAFAAARPVQ